MHGYSLVPPLRRAGGGAKESGDTAIQSFAERNAINGIVSSSYELFFT